MRAPFDPPDLIPGAKSRVDTFYKVRDGLPTTAGGCILAQSVWYSGRGGTGDVVGCFIPEIDGKDPISKAEYDRLTAVWEAQAIS